MSSYATRAELERFGGLPSNVLSQFELAKQDELLEASSALCDGYLRAKHAVPMTSPSVDLKIKVCEIASFKLMCQRGFNPEGNTDRLILKGYEDALHWLEQVSKGTVVLVSTADQTPGVNEGAPAISTCEKRGW